LKNWTKYIKATNKRSHFNTKAKRFTGIKFFLLQEISLFYKKFLIFEQFLRNERENFSQIQCNRF
jgi:hypothetical protein